MRCPSPFLRAATLGDDADTTAAIAGQLAGALWGVGGERGVPEEWVAMLTLRSTIEDFADPVYEMSRRDLPPGATAPRTTTDQVVRARAFWVAAPRFIAGAYPGDVDAQAHRAKLEALLELGVTHVVTLMEASEVGHGGTPFTPYAPHLEQSGVVVVRHPIRDVSTPSAETVTAVLDTIDRALASGGTVYLHCWGGRGRTGVIVGCWLVRHGWIQPRDAARERAQLRSRCADAAHRAPDTAEQLRRITS